LAPDRQFETINRPLANSCPETQRLVVKSISINSAIVLCMDELTQERPVPDGVDLDQVDASFKKGVLTVTLPKTEEAQKAKKKITVKAE
jgi:hypothetical protein